MSGLAFASVFCERAHPDFPFRDRSWIAVAFERNAYDRTYMPEWFFRAASKRLGDRVALLVAGDGFADAGLAEVCALPFAWEDYREFMARPRAYSLAYRMTGADAAFGCVADADMTVFAGEAARMEALLADVGGAGRLLEHMRQEFLLGDTGGYPEMDLFFQRLLFPSKREGSDAGA
ncbi:hypothetical protein [Lysobacter firmicutimachus]|uniref:Uncharacterized protein n=1 Tax=Lysobacter firmicutimachus TaxID=1792846 RepID=A0ABU8CZ23_9GAMM